MSFFKELKLPQTNVIFNVVASFLIVAFGQSFRSSFLGIIASSIGFALFWHGMLHVQKRRFVLSVGWFLAVQLVQLSWLARSDYLGPLIYGVYGLVSVCIALQFGALSYFVRSPMTYLQAAALSGLWVMFEWMRYLPLGGFSWNPVALALCQPFSILLASLFGVFGLSFWVMFTNFVALRRSLYPWLACAVFPYLFGFCYARFLEKEDLNASPKIALVQTSLLPDQKYYTPNRESSYVSGFIQWARMLELLNSSGEGKFDWIVFPEAAVPHGTRRLTYTRPAAELLLQHHLGKDVSLPDIGNGQFVDNAYFAKAIANHFGAEVIIGLDDADQDGEYNAAFHFSPSNKEAVRYEKQILIPVAESIPFSSWTLLSQFISNQFGIDRSFTPGKKVGIFELEKRAAILICLEEVYGELARKARRAGAEALISVSNDAWYPRSALPWIHLEHGRLRAAENGAPLIRSGNTGVSCVIDRFGRVVKELPVSESEPALLVANVSLQEHRTVYTFWGDAPILALSIIFFSLFGWKRLLEYRALD